MQQSPAASRVTAGHWLSGDTSASVDGPFPRKGTFVPRAAGAGTLVTVGLERDFRPEFAIPQTNLSCFTYLDRTFIESGREPDVQPRGRQKSPTQRHVAGPRAGGPP